MLGDESAEHIAESGTQRVARSRGFEPEEPATRSWNSNRTAPVIGVRHGNDAGGDGSRRAPTRTAGGAGGVPWITARAEQCRFSRRDDAELRCIRFTDDYESPAALYRATRVLS